MYDTFPFNKMRERDALKLGINVLKHSTYICNTRVFNELSSSRFKFHAESKTVAGQSATRHLATFSISP